MENNYDYLLDFEAFSNNFKKTEISGEEVGEMVMKMAGYFARYNLLMGNALRAFSTVKANFQNQVDPSTGKSMSSSKAELLADATDEAATYEIARIHVQNIEQFINSLKALQKGILVEYSHSG
jgi:hypothetical protein